jgi:hypothetical protein
MSHCPTRRKCIGSSQEKQMKTNRASHRHLSLTNVLALAAAPLFEAALNLNPTLKLAAEAMKRVS